MAEQTYEQELLNEFRQLNETKQQQAVEYVRGLRLRPRGETGRKIIAHAQQINWPKEDLEEMARAIEEACEQVDDFPEVDLDA